MFGSVRREDFGRLPEGTAVEKITLTSPSGLSLQVLTLGATVHALLLPLAGGKPVDVVLGKGTLAEYVQQGLGNASVMGRYANRIGGASYPQDGGTVQLQANFGSHILHGGRGCYAGRVFAPRLRQLEEELQLELMLLDQGEGGFPGQLFFTVTYRLQWDRVILEYRAVPTARTPWNVTSHAYFNLNGHGAAGDHQLWIGADAYLPAGPDGLPTGEILPVAGTAFDFRRPRRLLEALADSSPQLQQFGGYDHNFCLAGRGLRRAAVLRGLESGLALEVWTDQPGMQLFTFNQVPASLLGKDGASYRAHGAVCLETQNYPDAPNRPQFPNCFLEPGETGLTQTQWVFPALTRQEEGA